jgi:Glycosyltransferase family 29 (sialyltransferase)
MKFGLASLRRWIAERRSRRALRELLASLDGKSVAIVGNATSLLAHRHGALIDGHDVVVRMNMGFPVDAAAQGTRFDLWCFSNYRATLQAPDGFVAPRSVWMSPKFRDWQGGIDCCFYPIADWRALRDRLGARPSVGAMTIDLVSRASPRQVMVIGFDFNRSKTFYETRTLPSPHDFAAEERYVTDLIARRSWRFVAT